MCTCFSCTFCLRLLLASLRHQLLIVLVGHGADATSMKYLQILISSFTYSTSVSTKSYPRPCSNNGSSTQLTAGILFLFQIFSSSRQQCFRFWYRALSIELSESWLLVARFLLGCLPTEALASVQRHCLHACLPTAVS